MKIFTPKNPEMMSVIEILNTYNINEEEFENKLKKYEDFIPFGMMVEQNNEDLFIHQDIVEILFGSKNKSTSTTNDIGRTKPKHTFYFRYKVNVQIEVEEDNETEDEIMKKLKNL